MRYITLAFLLDRYGNWLVPEALTQILCSETELIKNDLVTITFEKNSKITFIEEGAFKQCPKLVSVDLSNCTLLTTLNQDLFAYCGNLETVILPRDGVLETLEGGCFVYSAITSITFPKSLKFLMKHKEETIGPFAYSLLSEILFYDENNLEIVDRYTFRSCNLAEFNIGPKLISIFGASFEMHSTRFRKFTQTEKNPIYTVENDILFTDDTIVYCPPGIKKPIIKEGIKIVGGEAFINSVIKDCTFLPNSLTELVGFSFYACQKLERIYIPQNVVTIGDRAFENCQKLVTVVFPKSIKKIGYSLFYNCQLLSSITIPYGVTTIDSLAFFNCQSLTHLFIPDSITRISDTAFLESGIKKCGIACSKEIRSFIKEQTKLDDSVFELCNKKAYTFTSCIPKFRYSLFIIVPLFHH